MEKIDLENLYVDFQADLQLEAEASSEPLRSSFFRLYSEIAAENGDCIDLAYSPVTKEGRGGYQIDGFAVDTERSELHVAICDFRQQDALETLNAADIDTYTKRIRNFVELSLDPSFINSLEETSPSFQAGYEIYSRNASIRRIRVIIFSNARLSTRRPPETAAEIAGKSVVYNFLDFSRYADICASRGTPEPIEIDIANCNGEPLSCLPAFSGSSEYESYLAAIPGDLLASIYSLYGARLLEQNVRTFLQARTKVNKGIIETIRKTPGMFFAYNNGITATASEVEIVKNKDGYPAISKIKDLQIVNGGQTTASILFAKDQSKSELQNVFVQMKLTVVSQDKIEDIVPKISRYANTQNKISEADFFSSHPFHIEMERYSRRLTAPPKLGSISGSKWFYERARGQYRDEAAYGSASEKKKFNLEYPKNQFFDKTDLSKYEMTFDCQPNVVSLGAQKCFIAFAEKTAKEWAASQLSFNEEWFKNAVAKALIFKWTDQFIGASDWYKADRGHKSQTVTYTLAWITNHIRSLGKAGLNYQLIWKEQNVPDDLAEIIQLMAPKIAKEIANAPPEVKNIGEYCKKSICWAAVSKMPAPPSLDIPDSLVVDIQEEKEEKKDARSIAKIDREINFDTLIVNLAPKIALVTSVSEEKKLLSPKSNQALLKIARYNFQLSSSEKNALKHLFDRLELEEIDVAKI